MLASDSGNSYFSIALFTKVSSHLIFINSTSSFFPLNLLNCLSILSSFSMSQERSRSNNSDISPSPSLLLFLMNCTRGCRDSLFLLVLAGGTILCPNITTTLTSFTLVYSPLRKSSLHSSFLS